MSTPSSLRKAALPEDDAAAVDDAPRAFAGRRLEIPRRRRRSPFASRRRDDRAGERMLGGALDGRREPQHLVPAEAVSRDDFGHRRAALGQRAGLVDHQRVDLFEALQRFGVLDQHAEPARRGRRQP